MKIPYGKQWIFDEDIEKVSDILKSNYLTTGPAVKDFEKAFAEYVGAKYAIAVANGTAALHLAAKALGVKSGSDVITSPMTFAATSNCVLYNSGTPIFADITERGLIDPLEIEKNLTEKTVGIIPIHYMGLPCELEEISKIAKENDLFIIEDACHSIGAKYKNSSIGDCKLSDLAVFSFHPVKHITTGEGGIITTNNEELFNLLQVLRTHGITKNNSNFKTNHNEPWYQEMQHLGFNYRLTDIQAALGLSQLSKIDHFVKRRREIAAAYLDFFIDFEDSVEIIPEKEYEFNSYHLFVIKLRNPKNREKLFNFLQKSEIYCQVHYIPVYWHPYYQELGYKEKLCPIAENFYEKVISLPMYPALTDEELDYVFLSLKKFFK
ncbi:MAG: UDP-4-amino-4,6-dideoxy-N-acetyl-beta-L-altrosamine transaminase [Candidatus Heimdallarchaeota archaeon]|nr:UDP-4-amino-4,6-dideoxy-N-acetyl-beta-L-altrosamine transaminase [Candidatus Heimdallarchaeota archaeon]